MFKNFIYSLFSSFSVLLPLVLSLAFYTLAERKVMASVQKRQGPKIVGIWGLLQPIVDGLKLLLKEIIVPSRSNAVLFVFAPLLVASISFTSWSVIPFTMTSAVSDVNLGLLVIFLLSSLNVYGLVLAGWSSNSKYALVGALRAIAQMISYEIVFGACILIIIFFSGSANLNDIVLSQVGFYNVVPLFPVFVVFLICIFAETNRAPFDLPEAESEIVAGYNVEYSSITFAMFFLAEYSNMILMSVLLVIIFFGGWLPPESFISGISAANPSVLALAFNVNWLILKTMVFLVLFVLVRAILPRYRFDQLMWAGWQAMFPIALSYFIFITGLFVLLGVF
jgi:NADH-quinone oxidoreductase subunit H